MKKTLQNNFLILLLLFGFMGMSQTNPWKKQNSGIIENKGRFLNLKPQEHSYFKLNQILLNQTLNNAPLRGAALSNVELVFPNYNGEMETFTIYEAPTFSPSLSAKYPEIRSFVGYSRSGSKIRFSKDTRGISATIFNNSKSTTYIQFLENSAHTHVVYTSKSLDAQLQTFSCSTIDAINSSTNYNSADRDANDQLLRTYRLAVSATGEYTQFHGGTVADALAAINTTITRVNMIFETDISVTFQIQDYEQLIYIDGSTDPFSDFDVGSDGDNYQTLDGWGVQLQNHLTSEIGNAAYDIGHLFGTNSSINGNAGCIGCVCNDDDETSNTDHDKGSGYTSSDSPTGEYFDLVTTHEIGHQMGANHTFSFNEEQSTITNSEPGSGSTVMSYAGITGLNNVQLEIDPYFHYHSIRQMTDNFATSDCWLNNNPITITNNPPIANAGNDYTIPKGTAYILKGNATDLDSDDNLTFCWEGTNNGLVRYFDFGPTHNEGSMVRSLLPSSNPNRYIPNLNSVASNQLTETNPDINSAWETVSTIGRTLDYALTVRDRTSNAVGLQGQTSYDTMQVTVDESSGPFVVTSQSSYELWNVDSEQTITWDVAGTDSGLINSNSVNILLSLDGGLSFPITLASDIPNTGSANIIVPPIGTDLVSNARVIVESNDNIFFAMNSANFYIQEIEFAFTNDNSYVESCIPDDIVFEFTYNTYLGFTGETTFSPYLLPEGLTATFSPETATEDGTLVTVTISETDTLDNGSYYPYYYFYVLGTSGEIVNYSFFEMIIFDDDFVQPQTVSPENNDNNVFRDVSLFWEADYSALSYSYEVSTDESFSNIIASGDAESYNSQPITGLESNQQYFWRVTPSNNCGSGPPSETFTFFTVNCNDNSATDVPITINESGPTLVYTSTMTVDEDFIIQDLNVLIDVTHTYNNDMYISLIAPNGQDVVLSSNNGGSSENYTNTIFDSEAENYIYTDIGPFTGTYKPEENLSILYGTSSQGEWTLRIADIYDQDGGTINNFTIEFCTSSNLLSYESNEQHSNEVNLYPNPSDGNFKISSNVPMGNTTINIYDINGRQISNMLHKNENGLLNKDISLNNINAGIYFVEITDGVIRTVKKLIIK